MSDLLRLLKERAIEYRGLDLPGDLASAGPALDHLDRLPGAPRQTLSAVRRHMSKFASAYTIPAFSAYREMAPIDRDALTLALAELSARFDATPRRPDPVARHELRLPSCSNRCCAHRRPPSKELRRPVGSPVASAGAVR